MIVSHTPPPGVLFVPIPKGNAAIDTRGMVRDALGPEFVVNWLIPGRWLTVYRRDL